jgi:fumarate hydratase subunit beta
MKTIQLPLTKELTKKLKAGDEVLISGLVYTARDQAHKRLVEAIRKEEKLPIDLENSIIYYTGPTPAPPGRVIGSCGPTTSMRMDPFTPVLLARGLSAMIGKGQRTKPVIKAIKEYMAVYFCAIGGAGALLSERIVGARVVAYADLGPEAIFELELRDFPAIVAVDSRGGNIFRRWMSP